LEKYKYVEKRCKSCVKALKQKYHTDIHSCAFKVLEYLPIRNEKTTYTIHTKTTSTHDEIQSKILYN